MADRRSFDFEWKFAIGDFQSAKESDFDGVYMNSDVWLNGHHLGHRSYGYISFYYDQTPFLNYDAPNVITVRVGNETVEQIKDPKRGIELLKMLAVFVNKIEPSRKITCAMHPGSGWLKGIEPPSQKIHHTDVVSYNYRTRDFDTWHEQYADYLFIASETQAYTAQ